MIQTVCPSWTNGPGILVIILDGTCRSHTPDHPGAKGGPAMKRAFASGDVPFVRYKVKLEAR